MKDQSMLELSSVQAAFSLSCLYELAVESSVVVVFVEVMKELTVLSMRAAERAGPLNWKLSGIRAGLQASLMSLGIQVSKWVLSLPPSFGGSAKKAVILPSYGIPLLSRRTWSSEMAED